MDVFQFSDVYHIAGLDQTAEHLEMGSYIGLVCAELEIVSFAFELSYFLID